MPPVEDPTGGKDEIVSPPDTTDTGGTITTPTPGEGQDQPEGQAAREPLIPRERFDDINSKLQQTEQELSQLRRTVEQQGERQRQAGGNRTWQDLNQAELDQIVANPTQFPDHFAAAIGERERRLEERILNRVNQTIPVASLKSANAEAFDPNTPLGREVARIMANKDQAEVLSDVIELAKYRSGKGSVEADARKKVVSNLKAAGATAPGSGSATGMKEPSPWEMPKDDFEASVQRTKLGRKE